MTEIIRDKEAFALEEGGYHFSAWYLKEPKSEALVEISYNGKLVKSFRWPAYKIWNIAAHAADIAAGLDEDSDDGLREAGSTGFGGNVWPTESEATHD